MGKDEAVRRLVNLTRYEAERFFIVEAARRALAALPTEAAVAGLDAERLADMARRSPAELVAESIR
jgi:hypothetical protein